MIRSPALADQDSRTPVGQPLPRWLGRRFLWARRPLYEGSAAPVRIPLGALSALLGENVVCRSPTATPPQGKKDPKGKGDSPLFPYKASVPLWKEVTAPKAECLLTRGVRSRRTRRKGETTFSPRRSFLKKFPLDFYTKRDFFKNDPNGIRTRVITVKG